MRKQMFKKILIGMFTISIMAAVLTIFALILEVNTYSILAGICLLLLWFFAFMALICYKRMV